MIFSIYKMYNVTIPSIGDCDVIKYLRSTNQIHKWKNDEKNNTEYTKRPTYRELIENDTCSKDTVFEWNEQFYNERGKQVGKTVRKYFSLHAYGRMIHEIYPKDNIIKQLQDIQDFVEVTLVGNDEFEKQYVDKRIETPDIFFRNMMKLTFIMYEKIQFEKSIDVRFRGEENLKKEAKGTFRVIKKVQPILDKMLQKYPTLIIHLSFEDALRISISYTKEKGYYYDKIEEKWVWSNDYVYNWDNWYLHHLLHYAPFFFQRPYYSKYRKIKELHNVYAYHMFTYQTKYFDGIDNGLTNTEIENLCGHDLKRIKELTPLGQRIPYNKLSKSRQKLVRQCFGEYKEKIIKIESNINSNIKEEKDYDTSTDSEDDQSDTIKKEYDYDTSTESEDDDEYIEERTPGGMKISIPVVNLISPNNSPKSRKKGKTVEKERDKNKTKIKKELVQKRAAV